MKEKVLITGGAGFIGSNLAEKLAKHGDFVRVYDNLSIGRKENVKQLLDRSNFEFVIGNLLDEDKTLKAMDDCEIVYHLAANSEVRLGTVDTLIDFEQNLVATRNLLEAMRKSKSAKTIVFTSTSTVYGEAKCIPTPEDYAPLIPISLYGASKLGCEALITAYSHLFGMRSVIYRLANVVGPRSGHGVIYDFIMKLRKNPATLEILGDGSQSKSYIYVDDCVESLLFGLQCAQSKVEIFNVGTADQVDVRTIASIVVEEMRLNDVKFNFTGGIDGRGWRGDVKFMNLDATKLVRLGWKPKYSSRQAVRLATRALL